MTVKTANELKGIQKKVYQIIQDCPEAADDDSILIEHYWQREGWDERLSLNSNLRNVTMPETITRRRRELHNMGLIRYSDQANKRREDAFVNEKQYAAVSWKAEECQA